MGRCLYWSNIPLTNVRNNLFWQQMYDAIPVVGPGYKSATSKELRGPILQAEKKEISSRLEEFKKSRETTDCTVMSDGWTDGKGRTLIKFVVHCPKGTMFIKSIDASTYVKYATFLCDLMEGFIQDIGVQNVVQIIADIATNYVVAGRMLVERNYTLFWIPCIAHCIDMMQEDMGEIPFIKQAIDQARSIPKFIQNHASVLSLMRRHTKKRS